ncbi:MAG: hypothetical protein MN733_06975 [Nitrososphaera sp.]|nr:hypothetical protein [Nitrososphaera sp.]
MTNFDQQEAQANKLVEDLLFGAAEQNLHGAVLIIPLINALVATLVALVRFGARISLEDVIKTIEEKYRSTTLISQALSREDPKQLH